MKSSQFTILPLLIIGFFLVSGCTTFDRGALQKVTILSQPNGASIYINGVESGTTPMEIALPRKVTQEIRLEKKGYNSAVKYFASTPNSKADNFIRFGLSEDLGYYLDLEPRTIEAKMKSDLVPDSAGANPFERMAQQALQADQLLEKGEISQPEHEYILEQIIDFFETQK